MAEWYVSMKGKLLEYCNCTEASKMIAIVVFVGVPIASLLHVYPKSLLSIALLMFHHRLRHHRDEIDTTNVHVEEEDQTDEEEDGVLGVEVDCIVCLCPVSRGDQNLRLLPCNHGFHHHCIESWLQTRSTCPLCRIAVSPLSPHCPGSNNNHQRLQLWDSFVSGFLCPFEKLCKWIGSPPNPELMSALFQSSTYLS